MTLVNKALEQGKENRTLVALRSANQVLHLTTPNTAIRTLGAFSENFSRLVKEMLHGPTNNGH
jgi:hypothetical protein